MTRPESGIPHRKNAAEWAMWIALQPLRWFLLLRAATKASRPHPGEPDGW